MSHNSGLLLGFSRCKGTGVQQGISRKSHYALLVAVQELFSNELEQSLIHGFENAMSLRQTADYGLTFSKEGALDVAETADTFLQKTKELLKVHGK